MVCYVHEMISNRERPCALVYVVQILKVDITLAIATVHNIV